MSFLGWVGIACSTHLWMPYVISAVAGAFGGAATSQLFAAVHDELAARPGPSNDGVVAAVRMALTASWVVGPVAGSVLAAHTSLRIMLVATAMCTLAQVIPLGRLRTTPAPPAVPAEDAPRPGSHRPGVRAMLPLLAFTGLYVLVYAGEPIKYAYLPIYMNGTLKFPPGLSEPFSTGRVVAAWT